ncbi:Uncharacterised protein [uncultured Comamonas sp.]|nr:Uncharacterised protein [uncultured Comamonas sp.]
MTKPQGQTMPKTTSFAAGTLDAIQLHGQAVNCAAMARWYTQRGNWLAAARKTRQHLAALRQLQQLEG